MLIGIDCSRAFVKDRTGTENYSYQLTKELIKIDKKNSYILYTRSTPLEQVLKSLNIQKLPSNVSVENITLPRLWTQVGLALKLFFSKPDLLFVPAHTLPIIRPIGLKTVVTIHDLGYEYLPQYHQFPHKLYLNRSTEFAVWQSTHLIAVSEATKTDLGLKLKAKKEKITVIYEGFDKDKYKVKVSDAERKRLLVKYGLNNPYVLFVGTLQPRKNISRLIKAFANIIPKIPKNIDLVIAGNKGWMYEDILLQPSKLKITDRVKFIGYVCDEDLPYLYSGTLCYCLPSLFEGFGLPPLEAMACGAPVLVSNTSSLPEVAGEAGVYVDPLNVDDMAEKLFNVISNQKKRLIMKEKSVVQSRKFSWEKCARETLEVFEKVADSY